MAKRRPGISAQSELSWAAKRMDVSQLPDEPSLAPPIVARVHHRAQAAPVQKKWRVVRLYRVAGEQFLEDIGAFKREEDAILLGTRELGHCRVLNPDGKLVSTNGQPIEDRTPMAEMKPDPVDAEPVSAVPAVLADVPAVSMFERLARDPSVTVEKLQGLIALQERTRASQAKAAFDAAFAVMQGEIPVIREDGAILVEGELRSKYATNEAIQEVVKPILATYGFSLRFRNSVKDNQQTITGILSHREGHSEEDVFVCPPDTSGKKNTIQAMGSTRSYGQRYTTIALLNIATRGTDDDGTRAPEQQPKSEAPVGYSEWVADLSACADEGWTTLSQTWAKSKQDYTKYLVKTDLDAWREMQQRAKAADQKAAGA